MREVVRRLHIEDSPAVLELLEFDYAMEAFLRSFETHAAAAQELYVGVRALGANDDDGAQDLSAVQDRAGRLSANASQILAAFQSIRSAIATWNIPAARRPSSQPHGPGNSSPPGGT